MLRRWLLALCVWGAALPAWASAQSLEDYDYENLAPQGIGLNVGYLWPSKVEPTAFYSVRLDLGYLGPGVRVQPSVSYWSSTLRTGELDRLAGRLNRLPPLQESGETVSGDELGPIDWSDLVLELEAHYVWIAPAGLMPYLGVGAGLHLLNGSGPAIKDTFVEDLLDTVTAGVTALGGVELQVTGTFRIHAEARFTLLSDINYPGLTFGGSLSFPQAGNGTAR
jgi:hypothetical protein